MPATTSSPEDVVLFLDEEELARLTGKIQPSAQRRFLLSRGYKFEVNGLGLPIVLRSAVEQKLGGTVPSTKTPNFEALNDGS